MQLDAGLFSLKLTHDIIGWLYIEENGVRDHLKNVAEVQQSTFLVPSPTSCKFMPTAWEMDLAICMAMIGTRHQDPTSVPPASWRQISYRDFAPRAPGEGGLC
jgi:hypothetical protein